MKNTIFYVFIALLALAGVIGCSSSKNLSYFSLKNIDSSLLGNFTDDYQIRYTITERSFTQHPGVKYNLLSYNQKEQYFIAQNDAGNVSDGGLYTRIDIMRFSNMEPWRWGFCLTAYQAPSRQAAIQTAAADRSNPKKGCGGYPFSRMKRY